MESENADYALEHSVPEIFILKLLHPLKFGLVDISSIQVILLSSVRKQLGDSDID